MWRFWPDRTWRVADERGTRIGTVYVDGDVYGSPDYWLRDGGAAPLLGLAQGSRIVWSDGRAVGAFEGNQILWRGSPVGLWQVDVTRNGGDVVFGGAWAWDLEQRLVAEVTNTPSAAGAYLTLHRQAPVDESLAWALVAFVLVTYEHLRREEAAAVAEGHRANLPQR
jgi:hypothetical protein